jgi:hypothetical protein
MLARDAGRQLSDDELLQEMARRVLEGPKDEGRASYQIHLSVCERCGAGEQRGGGEDIPVRPVVVEMAECDCQIVADGADSPRGEKPADSPGGTAPLHAPRGAKATQAVPPKTRRAVVRRHHDRCAVPGCRNHTFLDLHHVHRRGEGGDHDPNNLILLCGGHHKAEHEGRLIICGTADKGFEFHHADGAPYAGAPRPENTEVYKRAFGVLKSLHWKEGQARAAIDAVAAHVGDPVDTDTLVRAALKHLTRGIAQDEGPGYSARPVDARGGTPHVGIRYVAKMARPVAVTSPREGKTRLHRRAPVGFGWLRRRI